MHIPNIHHVQITVPEAELNAARDFYLGVLGLQETYRPVEFDTLGFWVKLGNADMHVGVEEDVDRRKTRSHIAYQVDDLEAWRAHLHARGIETDNPVQFAGHLRFQFHDPFGNYVEMIQVVAG